MDRTPVADGFDDNDLRLLSLRATSLKDALSELNRPPPFNEARLRAFLDLLEASEEPKDVQLVLEAIVSAHQSVRAAYGKEIGENTAPQAATLHTELAALRTELADFLGASAKPPPLSTPSLPDCTTDNGKPGYLINGTCYPATASTLWLGNEADINFAKLAAFQKLRDLSLPQTSISDLTPLERITNLEELDLADTPVSDLRACPKSG